MFEQFRDFLLYLYYASEKMEEKAIDISEERKKRMEDFNKHREEVKAKTEEKIKDMKIESFKKSQKQFDDFLKKAGVARSKDLDDLKSLLAKLNTKIDKLNKK